MSDTSAKSLEIVTKIVESSAYLNKDISLCPTISKSFRNRFKKYGPLTLPCVVPLLTIFHWHVTPLYTIIKGSSGLRFNFSTRRSCFTLSNAFEKSIANILTAKVSL